MDNMLMRLIVTLWTLIFGSLLIGLGVGVAHAEGETIAWEDWTSERCRLSWDYPDEDNKHIAGFRVYRTWVGLSLDTLGRPAPLDIADPTARTASCGALGVTQAGQLYVAISAYDGAERESDRSPPLAFVLSAPGLRPPVSVKIILAP